MITRIELENFKGVRERVGLDVKPITLLFGANSAGKSTVIHALHYALEVLARENANADRTALGGTAVDLGGFANLVHGHALGERIKIRFELDISDSSLPDYASGGDEKLTERAHADLDDEVMTAWLAFEVGWSREAWTALVYTLEVGLNGHPNYFARLEAPARSSQPVSLVLDTEHPLFRGAEERDLTATEMAELRQSFAERAAADIVGNDDEPWSQLRTPGVLATLLGEAGIEARPDGKVALPVFGQRSALPLLRTPLRFWMELDEEVSGYLLEARRIISKVVVGVRELLVARLERLLYVGPLRAIPPRAYEPPLTEDVARWADGLGAWDALHRRGDVLVHQTSRWMNRLGAGCHVELRSVTEVSGDGQVELQALLAQMVDHIETRYPDVLAGDDADEDDGDDDAHEASVGLARHQFAVLRNGLARLEHASTRRQLVLVDDGSGVALRPSDVGVGISQLLPVVVAALYRGERGAGAFVVLEQPELHIHPKLQVGLGDLFIEQSHAGGVSDHVFLLETHSEHLMLRLLRRIREASAGVDGVSAGRRGQGVNAGVRGQGVGRSRGPGGRPGGPGGRPPGPEDDDADATTVPISPATVNVVYVQRTPDGAVQFVPLAIDESGEFCDVWPEGFFEERLTELYE